MPESHALVQESAWPAWKRILFRYLCLHWLLYAWPSPFSSLFGAVVFWLGKVADLGRKWDWFDQDLTSWSQPVFQWFADAGGERLPVAKAAAAGAEAGAAAVAEAGAEAAAAVVEDGGGWWRELTSWISVQANEWIGGSWQFDVFHQRTGSGDTMHDLVKLGCIITAAGLLTILWSLLDRSRGYPQLGRWLHLGVRWWLALVLVGYGMAKFYGMTQHPEPGILGLTREIGDHSPMGMVWTFMGVSEPYKYMSGALECLGFALLLHRRTALLGCFVALAVMGNVCALNWLYGVPVKLYSAHLLLAAVFLMAPFGARLWALFVSNRFSESVELRVVRSAWLGLPLLFLGTVWAVGTVWQSHEGRVAMAEQYAGRMQKPELFGLWKVEQMLLDGEEVPDSDSSRWEYFAVDRGGAAHAKTLLGQTHYFDFGEDLEQSRVSIKPRGSEEAGEFWAVERSTVIRKVRNPAPRKMDDYGTPVDGERQAIVWQGLWDGKQLELHTVQKIFRVHDGFRLIREFPR